MYSSYRLQAYQLFNYKLAAKYSGNKTEVTCETDPDCITGVCVAGYCYTTNAVLAEAPNLGVAPNTVVGGYDVSDPNAYIWAESEYLIIFLLTNSWTPIGLRVFEMGNPSHDYVFLAITAVQLIATIAIAYLLPVYFKKHFTPSE